MTRVVTETIVTPKFKQVFYIHMYSTCIHVHVYMYMKDARHIHTCTPKAGIHDDVYVQVYICYCTR